LGKCGPPLATPLISEKGCKDCKKDLSLDKRLFFSRKHPVETAKETFAFFD